MVQALSHPSLPSQALEQGVESEVEKEGLEPAPTCDYQHHNSRPTLWHAGCWLGQPTWPFLQLGFLIWEVERIPCGLGSVVLEMYRNVVQRALSLAGLTRATRPSEGMGPAQAHTADATMQACPWGIRGEKEAGAGQEENLVTHCKQDQASELPAPCTGRSGLGLVLTVCAVGGLVCG